MQLKLVLALFMEIITGTLGVGHSAFSLEQVAVGNIFTPYASEEGKMMIEDGDSTKSRMRDSVSPFVLNAVTQFGFGDTDIFPRIGLGGNVSVCCDFGNLYGKFSADIDAAGFGIYFGGYANFTRSRKYSNYLSGGFIEVRLAL